MGFRAGFVLSSTFFLYGVLFLCSVVDFPLVYHDWKAESADAAETFYISFFRAPTAIHALLHGMISLGLVGLLAKLHRWSEVAKYYDGGSLLLARSSVTTQRRMVADAIAKEAGLEPPETIDITSPLTPDERIQGLRVIAASNTIVMLLLAGVVLMQATEWYLAHLDAAAAEKERRRLMRELAASAGSTPGPSSSRAIEGEGSSTTSALASSTAVSTGADKLKKRS
ncbi:unnamed protein product [Tilletia caries]|nr:unnamed protein product [Tilletia caries]CAD6937014.1 unnamed protein product [Tilletia caries]CAD7063265.1 unnamed protein product [Tilletia caries]